MTSCPVAALGRVSPSMTRIGYVLSCEQWPHGHSQWCGLRRGDNAPTALVRGHRCEMF
jgi:hypothetical protein